MVGNLWAEKKLRKGGRSREYGGPIWRIEEKVKIT